jgi:hypothetical protein
MTLEKTACDDLQADFHSLGHYRNCGKTGGYVEVTMRDDNLQAISN